MITYQKELFVSIMHELPELFYYSWFELEEDKDKIPLAVDWSKFIAKENSGILHILTVRDNGLLIGYVFWHVMCSPHTSTTSMAINDLIYLSPGYRKGWIGVKLLNYARQMARDLGVKKIYYNAKFGSKLARLLMAMRKKPAEIAYAELL